MTNMYRWVRFCSVYLLTGDVCNQTKLMWTHTDADKQTINDQGFAKLRVHFLSSQLVATSYLAAYLRRENHNLEPDSDLYLTQSVEGLKGGFVTISVLASGNISIPSTMSDEQEKRRGPLKGIFTSRNRAAVPGGLQIGQRYSFPAPID